jgi:hypothetical protein
MGNTVEQEQDIAFSEAFVQEWLKTAPKQVSDHFKTVTDGYERLKKEIGRQEEQIARQEKLSELQRTLVNSQASLLTVRSDEVDHLNDDKDEQRITTDPEFIGWNLVGGIRFGKAAVIRNLGGQDFLKVSIAPMTNDFSVDFDIFPLAVKRGRDGTLLKFVVDFTKGLTYQCLPLSLGCAHRMPPNQIYVTKCYTSFLN